MNTPLRGSILTGATLALAALCAPLAARAASPPTKAARTVIVTNTRSVPVDVYVESGGFDTRLGSVAAGARKELKVPKYLDSEHEDARIVVHPQIGEDLASPDLTLPAHGSVKILVAPNDVGYVPQPIAVIPGLDAQKTTITVDNKRDDAVEVELQEGDFDTTIGTVPAKRLQTFDIPAYLVSRDGSQAQIYLHPKRGFDLSSQFLTLLPKAHLEVVVPKRGVLR